MPGSYIVRLRTGHTLAAHFKVLGGREPEHTPLENGTAYFAFLPPSEGGLDWVREDPGVELVEDDTPDTGLGSTAVAPYFSFGAAGIDGEYTVYFREGHDLEKHFAHVGRRFEVELWGDVDMEGYDAKLDEELLAAIKRDPGVEQVGQNAQGEVLSSGSTYTAPYFTHGADAVEREYMITFRKGHDIEKHFAHIGRRVEVLDLGEPNGRDYSAKLDEELLAAVRRDPGVEMVEQDSYGEAY